MRSLERFVGTDLRWQRRGVFGRTHELMGDDGELYGRLTIQGVLASHGLAEMEGRRLELRWGMLFDRGVRISDADTGERVGQLHLGLLDKGVLRLESGRGFKVRISAWRRRCIVTDDMDEVQFTMVPGAFYTRVRVTLGTGLLSRRELPVMLSAAMYAMLMVSQEAGAAAAGV